MAVTPWQLGNIFGPRVAIQVKGDSAGRMIRVAKNPLLIAGANTLKEMVGDKPYIEFIVELLKARNMPFIATGASYKEFIDRGLTPIKIMNAVEVVDRLRDPEWSINGNGPHDLVIFAGLSYQYLSQLLSCIKHFATHLRTICLDRYYHPNADLSFPNLTEEQWIGNLKLLLDNVKSR
ncbi:MAG: CO dehydrogenase/acetyl-CoA synthase complex subunit epsilon [Candidatus Methanomethylicia archaeon]